MQHIINQLEKIVGIKNCLATPDQMVNFTTSVRGTLATAFATVIPNSLIELWQVAKVAVEHDLIVICQAANTSLTGGSTPDGEYERPVLIISTIKLDKIQLINDNKQAICFAGSRLYELEEILADKQREPHSVLGSSCVGASIVGGICNNAGGALIKRGPSYTQYSLFAKVEDGKLILVNELGIDLGTSPEEILANLEVSNYKETDVINDPKKLASSIDYVEQVVKIDEDSPARYNNDPKRLYQASGSAGKLVVFAVRTDTFAIDPNKKTFYIATKNPDLLMEIRRDILGAGHIPDQAEYMDANAYDHADLYGRDLHLIISKLGTKYMPKLFALRSNIQQKLSKLSFFKKYPPIDYALDLVNKMTPSRLSSRMVEMRKDNAHFLILCTSDTTTDFVEQYLAEYFKDREDAQYIECTEQESDAIQLHRFVIGNAEGRFRLKNRDKMDGVVNLDIALKRNATKYVEDDLPENIKEALFQAHSFGHFFCLVFHNYYMIKPGYDPVKIKELLLEYQDKRGAEYPAEHNVGHLYYAKEPLVKHFKELNPNNRFNPGVGKTSRLKDWK